MELGPLQKKWVEALRSGKYKQYREDLKGDSSYCCLGVANECLKLGESWDMRRLEITYDKLGLRSPCGEFKNMTLDSLTHLQV